jgi:hypothetical protein
MVIYWFGHEEPSSASENGVIVRSRLPPRSRITLLTFDAGNDDDGSYDSDGDRATRSSDADDSDIDVDSNIDGRYNNNNNNNNEFAVDDR